MPVAANVSNFVLSYENLYVLAMKTKLKGGKIFLKLFISIPVQLTKLFVSILKRDE